VRERGRERVEGERVWREEVWKEWERKRGSGDGCRCGERVR
jgi:hypothetical protein